MSTTSDLTPGKTVSCAFVFFDIVGYSKLPAPAQVKAVSVLKAIAQRAVERAEVRPEDVVALPTGDGMVVAFPEDRIAAVLPLAAVMQSGLAAACPKAGLPELGLRTGLHVGEVYVFNDINGSRNLAGHGVNHAQRIMDFGDTGHILCSDRFRSAAIERQKEASSAFTKVGTRYDKHGFTYEVWNVVWGGAGNPAAPKRGKATPALEKQHQTIAKTLSLHVGDDKKTRQDAGGHLRWAEDLAREWNHPFVGLEHVVAAPLQRNHSVSVLLKRRLGMEVGPLLAALQERAWEGECHASWAGRPLTPATSDAWRSLGTSMVEEAVAVALRQSLSVPAILFAELVPELDVARLAQDVWPVIVREESSPPGQLALRVCRGPEDGRPISLERKTITIGRLGENDVALPYDSTVSGRHAQIAFRDGNWCVEDLKSRNGTRFDGKPLTEPVFLRKGARIEIGQVTFAVV
jgi:class 3 adenylate cyclase